MRVLELQNGSLAELSTVVYVFAKHGSERSILCKAWIGDLHSQFTNHLHNCGLLLTKCAQYGSSQATDCTWLIQELRQSVYQD